MPGDIVSKATRTEFRECLVASYYVREIDEVFDAVGVQRDEDYSSSHSSVRRNLVEQYYSSVDWTSWKSVKRILSAYEYILIHLAEESRDNLEKLLLRDGLRFDGIRIARIQDAVVTEDKLQQIADSLDVAIINEQVARLRGAIDDDPALAIGTAKELLESICKGIIHEFGIVLSGHEDIPALVKLCLKSMHMAREDIENDKKGAEARKQIASGIAAACQGITELRNIYGTGHGRGPNANKASVRDARLAVGAATTLGVFLAEVYDFRRCLDQSKQKEPVKT